MYEGLIKRLRRCEQFRCRGCEYEQVMGCRAKLNAEAADAIAELSAKYQKALSDLVKQAQPPKDGKRCMMNW